jgi:hypothetical protein
MRGGGLLSLIAGGGLLKKFFGNKQQEKSENHIHMHLPPGGSMNDITKQISLVGGARRSRNRLHGGSVGSRKARRRKSRRSQRSR